MNVREIHDALGRAIEAGHGDVEAVFLDTAAGVSSDVNCYGTVSVVEDPDEEAGVLCEADPGSEYVAFYS